MSNSSMTSLSSASSESESETDCSSRNLSTRPHSPFVPSKPKRKRRRRSLPPKSQAPWQLMLNNAQNPGGAADPTSIDGRYFRRRFRLPYDLFNALNQVMLADNWFPGEYEHDGQGNCDGIGIRGASIQVKHLSVLRVLGRGVCFDEMYDGSGLSESTLSRFFHRFTSIFASRMFHKVVVPPKTPEELGRIVNVYTMLGLVGAVGSTDCTHVPLGKCPASWRNVCVGKEGFPTLSYSMTCDHTRKIMACSGGFPGSYNDKTIARYDQLISELGTNPLFVNHRYNIWTAAGTVERTGAHFICDGGYHNWKTLMCGLKHTSDTPSHIWSIQMESVRKDIECCFGILKVRFKVLTYPIQYHSIKNKKEYVSKINNTVWSCCILHNLLLGYDGLDKLWSEEDYLGTWYADPDAEPHPLYDRHTLNHNSIIQQRLNTRKFKTRVLGLRHRPSGAGAATAQRTFTFVPEPDTGTYANFGTNNDEDPVEHQLGFQEKRLELIAHFNAVWNGDEVLWLPFPGSRA